jgi:uncharacterized protein YkwD
VLAGFTLAPAAAAPAHVPAVAACPNDGLVPTPQNLSLVREASLCLVNRLRAAHGVRPLLRNSALLTASQRHAEDMVRRRYFSHTTKGGLGYFQRLLRSGYRLPGRTPAFGEALGYDYGQRATPRAMLLNRVMLSALHHNWLMGARFQHLGVGAVAGPPFPQPGFGGATYVFAVGRR